MEKLQSRMGCEIIHCNSVDILSCTVAEWILIIMSSVLVPRRAQGSRFPRCSISESTSTPNAHCSNSTVDYVCLCGLLQTESLKYILASIISDEFYRQRQSQSRRRKNCRRNIALLCSDLQFTDGVCQTESLNPAVNQITAESPTVTKTQKWLKVTIKSGHCWKWGDFVTFLLWCRPKLRLSGSMLWLLSTNVKAPH